MASVLSLILQHNHPKRPTAKYHPETVLKPKKAKRKGSINSIIPLIPLTHTRKAYREENLKNKKNGVNIV